MALLQLLDDDDDGVRQWQQPYNGHFAKEFQAVIQAQFREIGNPQADKRAMLEAILTCVCSQ